MPETNTSGSKTDEPILEMVDVVKTFGRGTSEVRALGGIDLTVEAGEFVAVMGPSGCGKSTLLHLAGALEDPSSGRVLVGGRDLGDLDLTERATLRRTDVGFVFQTLNLLPSLTALENVSLPLELEGVGVRESARRAVEALAAVGLHEQLKRYPDDFSGGQQQRIAIARAIVAERRLILADEPTGALDTMTSDRIIELLASLPARYGTAIVLVTHEPRFASWSDRVVFMRDGVVVDQTESRFGEPRVGAAG